MTPNPDPGRSFARKIAALFCGLAIVAVLAAQVPGLNSGPFAGSDGVLFTQLPSTSCGTADTCQKISLIYPQIATSIAPNLKNAGFAQQLTGQHYAGQPCKLGDFNVSGGVLLVCDPYWTDQFGTPIGLFIQK
jgi:hypothetical protein